VTAAVVTGGATGIGLGIASRLIDDGARVMIAGLTDDEVSLACETLGEIPVFSGNLAEAGAAEELLAKAVAEFGAVDVLVNNAGGGVIQPTLEHTEETLRATIDNNLWTTLRCCLAILPHMKERGYGRIINIGAESVRNGLMDHAVYNAAKGGVHGLTTGLAREFAGDGITVNAVAPSYTLTPELARALEEGSVPARLRSVVDTATALIPAGRPATVEEVAATVSFLATDDARFVTGQIISVNGGSSMG
jgi:2,3-dihydroxy-2,3-dihydro-p-cumate dehydrogenase